MSARRRGRGGRQQPGGPRDRGQSPGEGRRMNAEWHAAHPMPHHVSYEERVAWHLEHQRHCGCRPLPAGVADQFRLQLQVSF